MKNLTKTARTLRHNSTDAERKLWSHIRAKQLEGFKFRRQQPIGNYIVDFICLEKRLIIELDGGQHAIYRYKDIVRDNWLINEGFQVIRFWNNDVLNNHEGVLSEIRRYLLAPSPLPSPPSGEY
jgi:very-short-patch-repair endonuclease